VDVPRRPGGQRVRRPDPALTRAAAHAGAPAAAAATPTEHASEPPNNQKTTDQEISICVRLRRDKPSPFSPAQPDAPRSVGASLPSRTGTHFCVSTETPSHRFGRIRPSIAAIASAEGSYKPAAVPTWSQNASSPSSECIRPGRFVSTWNVCCSATAITANTWAIKSAPTASCHKSDMLFRKTRRGRRHCRGSVSRSGHSRTSKPCSNGCPGTPRHRSANVSA
jgi:hypothetical protein